MKTLVLTLVLLCASSWLYAMEMGGMLMDDKGMIMNANSDTLPRDCTAISETVDITIRAGQQHAQKFTGKMFAFGTFTSTKINSPVAEARKDNFPCISGVENPSIPRSTTKP